VGDVEHDVGESEGFVGRRWQKLIQLPPADFSVDEPPAQPDSASDDPVHGEIAVPFEMHLDDGVARDEVRMTGIADNEVVDLLGTEADAIEMIAGCDPSFFEL